MSSSGAEAVPPAVIHSRGMQRGLIALVQVLGLATWFSASAVVPMLEVEWGISHAAAVWLTAATQLGFVAGAVASAVLGLADRMPAHLLIALSTLGATAFTLCFAWFANSLALAIPLRFATGVFLAGVYPVGMKLMASWAPPSSRARSMGLLIGALTVGSALPHMIGTIDWDWRLLMTAAALVTLGGGVVCIAFVRPGPFLTRSSFTPDPKYVLRMFADVRARLVNFGYLGHMWELYALWTWLPIFAAYALAEQSGGGGDGPSRSVMSLSAFLAIGVAGLVGALIGGWTADRWGRPRTAAGALIVSGACCLLSPLAFTWAPVVLLVFGAVWGASVIADSGVFSTMLSEVVDGPQAGTALTAQTAAGFLLTVVSIQIVPLFAGLVGWQWALSILALGPVIGVVSMLGFRRLAVPVG